MIKFSFFIFIKIGAQWIHGKQHFLYDYAKNDLKLNLVEHNYDKIALYDIESGLEFQNK